MISVPVFVRYRLSESSSPENETVGGGPSADAGGDREGREGGFAGSGAIHAPTPREKDAPTVARTSSVWWKSRELIAALWSRKKRPGAIDLTAFSSKSTMAATGAIERGAAREGVDEEDLRGAARKIIST